MSETTEGLEFVTRYSALGIEEPDVATMCQGQCEGTGWVPIMADEDQEYWIKLWKQAHEAAGEHECDGTHFVKCPDCNGSGKRAAPAL